jgi:hypothetical protein
MWQLLALVAFLFLQEACSLLVTFRNDVPRLDTAGEIIDCHSGMVLPVNGTYYMYGEHYGNNTGFGPSPPALFPKIVVYTSPDMQTWTNRGEVLKNYPNYPYGTFFTPWAAYQKSTGTFVLWFNSYMHGCCDGGFGVATSTDGLTFDLLDVNLDAAMIADCNSLLVDDDGSAYMFSTSEAADHHQFIAKLNSTWTGSDNFKGTGYFPDRYVEGGMLWKRNGLYYAAYGSCCCFCSQGSGFVVYSSPNISAPPIEWRRQPFDLNCNSTDPSKVCGGFGDRNHDPITVPAQGIGLSIIPLADGSSAYLWHGERWLSAAGHNPTCDNECSPCTEPPSYVKGQGYTYWVPLQFDAQGNVLHFEPFVDSFTLDVAVGFGVQHLSPREAEVAALPGLA